MWKNFEPILAKIHVLLGKVSLLKVAKMKQNNLAI